MKTIKPLIACTIRYARSTFTVALFPGLSAVATVDGQATACGSYEGGVLSFPALRADVVDALNRKFANAARFARV